MSLRRKILGVVLVLIIGAWAYRPAEKYFEIAKSLDIFSTLFKEVNTYYVDEVDPKKLIDKSIYEMLNTLDPYTDYIPEEDGESFSIQTTGQYAGIGALIGVVNKKTVIRQTYIGFPAHEAGMKVGDELISIEGKNVRGQSSGDVSLLLKGVPKTEVEVIVRRPGLEKEIAFKLKREKIKLTNVVCEELVGNAGYIKLDDFTPGAAKEVENALGRLKKAGAKGIVLDLRENLGGLMFEAVNIVNLFIPKGQDVVATKGKAEDWNKTYRTLSQPVDLDIPLVVLVGRSSASASEIVAGALQDYDRAALIGEKTFGKGLVQTTRQLPYNAQLKVTTAKYYIPSGRCIQAMDYTHRKSDGTVTKVADSLKGEFKTKNGRKVFDGGGLDPDLKVSQDRDIPVLDGLFFNDYFFEYANLYCSKNPQPANLKAFKISDKDYSEFVAWLKTNKFNYSTELESQVNEMLAEAKETKQSDDVLASLKTLKSKIEETKDTDLIRHKDLIQDALTEEIGFHYGLHKGRFEVSLNRDKELQTGIQLLSDSPQLKKILLASNGPDSKP
jgi:carboxyl-terminal processing protease